MDEYVLVHTKDLPRKMVLNLAVITKPSRKEGKEEAKTTSSGREPKLHNLSASCHEAKCLN
jgi:hypothetical protein